MKTMLERAKGSALDITSTRLGRAETLALLSPHARQLRTIDFVQDHWSSIQKFSEAASGPLLLLNTLKIDVVRPSGSGWANIGVLEMNPPSLPLFSGAVNLRNFILQSRGAPFLNHFAFPNLTAFGLRAMPEEFPVSQLLDFLEASPTLQMVYIEIVAEIHTEDVLPERVVILPNVKILSVIQDRPGYRIAAHISCPSARLTSLIHEKYDVEYRMPQEVFPASASWNAIGPQYMASRIDAIALRITTTEDVALSCFLSFLSFGSATLKLGYRIIRCEDGESLLGDKYSRVFSHAFRAVQTHPLLSNIKHLQIWDRHGPLAPHQLAHIAREAARLFKFVGPLEELVLDVDDLGPFLSPFFDPPEFQVSSRPHALPLIKRLRIVEQPEKPLSVKCVAAIVKFVKSQHIRGVPFEHATFHMKFPPLGMAERLKPWVGTAHFFERSIRGGDQDPM